MQQGLYSDMELIEALWEHTFTCATVSALKAPRQLSQLQVGCAKSCGSHRCHFPAHSSVVADAVFQQG